MTQLMLRVVIADDERPARRFLIGAARRRCAGVQLVGEAVGGEEAVALIEAERPHLALLDLQMPELGGLDVVRRVSRAALPLVAFVTAFDDYAVEAFELNAIDYLLEAGPERASDGHAGSRARAAATGRSPSRTGRTSLAAAATAYERAARRQYLERIPVRRRDRGRHPAGAADRVRSCPRANCSTSRPRRNERYTITHRLHALEARLDPRRFVRLGRGTLANIDLISRVSPMPGGTYLAIAVERSGAGGQPHPVARAPRNAAQALTRAIRGPISTTRGRTLRIATANGTIIGYPEGVPDDISSSIRPLPASSALTAARSSVLPLASLAQQGAVVSGSLVHSVTAKPVEGATVVVEGTYLGRSPISDGMFTLDNVPAGAYHLLVTANGFVPTRKDIDVGTARADR